MKYPMESATKEEIVEIRARKSFERDLLSGKFSNVDNLSWSSAPEFIKSFYRWIVD